MINLLGAVLAATLLAPTTDNNVQKLVKLRVQIAEFKDLLRVELDNPQRAKDFATLRSLEDELDFHDAAAPARAVVQAKLDEVKARIDKREKRIREIRVKLFTAQEELRLLKKG